MPGIALKAGLVGIVVLVSLATGRPALRTKAADFHKPALGFGEAFAAGIFLGAGLIHMLGDAQSAFDAANVNYPFAMVTCGAVMLLAEIAAAIHQSLLAVQQIIIAICQSFDT